MVYTLFLFKQWKHVMFPGYTHKTKKMKKMKKMNYTTLVTAVAVGSFASANAASVILDFESGTTGWSFETETGATGTPTYTSAAGTGATPTTSGVINSSNSGTTSVPGGYLLNSGGTAFDATQAITGSFDFQFDRGLATTDNYLGSTFLMGNITSASGLTGDAGQFIGAAMGRNTFGNRTYVIDGAGGRGTSTGGIDIRNTLEWHTVTFSWTPSSGTTGTLEYTMTNQRNGATNSVSGTNTLDSNVVYFAFGSAPASGTIQTDSYFDNIDITGATIPVPEPSSTALLGLGGLALILRKHR